MIVIAVQPANATAAWPDGSPPRSGVPWPVAALIASTTTMVNSTAPATSSVGAACRLVLSS